MTMKAAAMLAVLGVLSTLLVSTMAYPTGPPVADHPEVCQDMFPSGHGVPAQTVAAPFNVTVTCNCYVPGMQIYVMYTVNHANVDPLEGIFLQARPSTGNIQTNEAVGTFNASYNEHMTTLNCNGNVNSAVGHNKEEKERCKGSIWKAPAGLADEVKFVATVLLHKAEFWTFVESETIKLCPGGNLPTTCSTVTKDQIICTSGGVTLHPVGLVTVLSSLLVILTTVISF